jgi:hypothetical protein
MALSGYRLKVLVTVISLFLLLVPFAVTAVAQAVYDPEVYRQLADASSGQTIPPGTKITAQNWTTYRRFIHVGMQNAFSGKYPIRIGADPQYIIEISPTQHFSQPRKYLEDTEKYLGQEQLVQSPAGGFNLAPSAGKMAGLPFGPKPTEPNLAWKILYNGWLTYQTRVAHAISNTWAVDPYRNAEPHTTDITVFRLAHLSEPGFPPTLPFAGGYLSSQRTVVLAPEQQKYNTTLKLSYQDPEQVPEMYSFVPANRRPLRLSTAARCKPLPGSDFVEDDTGFQFPNFKITLLGVKKLVARIQDPVNGFGPGAYDLTGSFPGWPKPGTGTWQLRDAYVIEATPLPVMGTYCYSHKIFYLDTETWVPHFNEAYDESGRFWKLFWPKYAPVQVGDTTILLNGPAGQSSGEMLDFKRNHATVTIQGNVAVGEKVPREYQDAQQLAFPAGLHEVNQ